MRMKIITKAVAIIVFQFIFLQNYLLADEIYLKNEDKISGKVIEENKEVIVIETEAMGAISVKKEHVERVSIEGKKEVVKAEEKKEKTKLWEKKISLGCNEARGNSENSRVSIGFCAKRKTKDNEFTIETFLFRNCNLIIFSFWILTLIKTPRAGFGTD